MGWHLSRHAVTVRGLSAPFSFILVSMGLAYTAWYCVDSAVHARIDQLVTRHDPATWYRRLRWRAMLAWLHFLEPIARDWGRLRGGLTPWRSALRAPHPAAAVSPWWQRMQPLRRAGRWSYSGTMNLEKYALLQRLSGQLRARNCAVGWNSDWQDWDLRVWRGALGEIKLRLAVEHHGGPRRVAKVAVATRQTTPFYWVQAALAVAALGTGALGLWAIPAVLAALLALLWIGLTAEANRLEATVRSVADEVAAELDPQAGDAGPPREDPAT